MKRKALSIFILLLPGLCFKVKAQTNQSTPNKIEEAYLKNINKDYLYGVYIPIDVPDAFVQLNKLIDANSKKTFTSVPEDEACKRLHFSLGRWIIYNWQFYEGSRLSHSIRQMGITHPDDMAELVMRSYHRNLLKKPLDIETLVDTIKSRRLEAWKKKRMEGEVIFEEKRVRSSDN